MVPLTEIGDAEIRIISRRTVLERLVMGGGAAPAGVPSFVRKWRTMLDDYRTILSMPETRLQWLIDAMTSLSNDGKRIR